MPNKSQVGPEGGMIKAAADIIEVIPRLHLDGEVADRITKCCQKIQEDPEGDHVAGLVNRVANELLAFARDPRAKVLAEALRTAHRALLIARADGKRDATPEAGGTVRDGDRALVTVPAPRDSAVVHEDAAGAVVRPDGGTACATPERAAKATAGDPVASDVASDGDGPRLMHVRVMRVSSEPEGRIMQVPVTVIREEPVTLRVSVTKCDREGVPPSPEDEFRVPDTVCAFGAVSGSSSGGSSVDKQHASSNVAGSGTGGGEVQMVPGGDAHASGVEDKPEAKASKGVPPSRGRSKLGTKSTIGGSDQEAQGASLAATAGPGQQQGSIRLGELTISQWNRSYGAKPGEVDHAKLGGSIAQHGLLQEIVLVKASATSSKLQVLCGAHRMTALIESRGADGRLQPHEYRVLDGIHGDDPACLDVSLAENRDRKAMSPIEQARFARRLVREHAFTQATVGEKFQVDRAVVSQLIELVEHYESLPGSWQMNLAMPTECDANHTPVVTVSHWRVVAGMLREQGMTAALSVVLEQCASEQWSTKVLARHVQALKRKEPTSEAPPSVDDVSEDAEVALEEPATPSAAEPQGAGGGEPAASDGTVEPEYRFILESLDNLREAVHGHAGVLAALAEAACKIRLLQVTAGGSAS